ncbi:MAG: lipoyl(octanoyl) transferase LipB [Candidatus Omnitrophota bacterium]
MLDKLSLTGLNFLDLGLINYLEALKIQKEAVLRVIGGLTADTLIFCEHYDVITVGRSGNLSNILLTQEELDKKNIKVIFTDRGGDVTYHGKGQLIVYPIFDLRKSIKDVHLFLRRLEFAVINLLTRYRIFAHLKSGKTGVWVKEKKIASIGVAFSHWVSYHGLSLNVAPDLSQFCLINPCGLKGVKMTSLKELLGGPIDMEGLKNRFKDEIVKIFYADPWKMKGEFKDEKVSFAGIR